MYWLRGYEVPFQISIRGSKPKTLKWCQTTRTNSNEGPSHFGYHTWNDMGLGSRIITFIHPCSDPTYAYVYAYDHQMIARWFLHMLQKWISGQAMTLYENHRAPAIEYALCFHFLGHRSPALLLFSSTLFSIICHAAAVLHKSWPRDSWAVGPQIRNCYVDS